MAKRDRKMQRRQKEKEQEINRDRDSNALTNGVKERLVDKKIHKRKVRKTGRGVERQEKTNRFLEREKPSFSIFLCIR